MSVEREKDPAGGYHSAEDLLERAAQRAECDNWPFGQDYGHREKDER